MGRALGIAIICAPFISALLLATHRGGRALTSHYRKDHQMTPALRYGHTATLTAAATLTGAAWLATHQHWLFAASLLYTAALFAWIATREYALHRRTLAEHDWARRHALGEQPPPLDPCCHLSRATHGAAHNHRCTDTTRWHTEDPETTP